MLVATMTSALAYTLYSGQKATNKAAAASQQDSKLAKTQEEILGEILQIDILRLELGYELLPLINYTRGHKLTDQIKALRKQMAKDLGMVIPPVRIQDNLQLDARSYNIKIKDIVCGDGQIEPSKLLVMESRGQEIELPGQDTTEPTFGLKARWIEEGLKESAHFKGYTVVDPPTVIITHLTEIIRQNITELLTASDTQKLIDGLTVEHKKLVSDLMPNQITLTTVQRILQGLLSEGISIRDLPTIIEAIAENVPSTGSSAHNVMGLIENIRARLSLQICNMYKNEQGYLPLVVLTPQWEQAFAESLITTNEGKQLSMAPSQLEEFVTFVNSAYETILLKGESPVLLVSAAIRPYVRSVIERFKTSLPVISQNEVNPKAKIKTLGQI
jgi:flagellar biosynthesis protein FlhA